MKKKLASVLVSTTLIAAMLAGCGSKAGKDNMVTGELDLAKANPAQNEQPIANPPQKMTMASTISATAAGQTLSLGDIAAFKELEKITGVQVDYTTVTADKLSLLFASDDLPDMIFTNWDVLGGTYKYAYDGQLIPLDKYVEKNSPNFINVLKKDETVYNNLKDADGKIYYFPFIRPIEELRVFEGFQIRRDWLDKLGLSVPKTVDEMYDVLKAFKEQDPNGNGKADEIPFISDAKTSGITQAMNWWGIDSFYVENGEVKCGWLTKEYKDYITTLAKWYKEGLIDPDYLVCDTTQFRSKAVNELSGMWYGRVAGVLGVLETAMKNVNPEFSIVGVPWLSQNGKTGYAMPQKYIENVLGIGIAITSQCKDPDLAAKWCDYAYGEDGNHLFNFGIEGKSYTMEDGIPTYTKEITQNPNGLSISEALASYAIPGNYAFEQSPYYFDQFMSNSQKDAIDTWKKGNTSRILPSLRFNNEEIENATNRKNEISTFVSEMTSKYIVGKEDMDSYDKFVEEIKNMGIEDVLKSLQSAYDRKAGK